MSTDKAREVLAGFVPETWRTNLLNGADDQWGHIKPHEAIAAMQAYAKLYLDEAAKVASDIAETFNDGSDADIRANSAAEEIATAIEKLKEQP